jgi:hypothetical protein
VTWKFFFSLVCLRWSRIPIISLKFFFVLTLISPVIYGDNK